MQRFIPFKPPGWSRALLVAAGATAAAWVMRGLLQPLVADKAPYATFFAAVLIAGIFGGWRGGAIAAVLGGLAGNFAFVGSANLKLNGHDGAALALFLIVAAVLVGLVHALTQSLQRERELNHHLGTVSSEYRHRIKNLLTVIQSMIQQTGRSATSTAEFEEKLVGRLGALSRAQDLLLDGQSQAVGLHAVVGESLRPFALGERLVQPTGGPDVHVPAETAVAISLLLNELATNAAKYGALAVAKGRLRLGWTVREDEVVLDWKELDGPPVDAPKKAGFGSQLIDRAIARTGGAAELHFEPDGVRCEIRMSLAVAQAPSPA